ncbi:hypothetical protein PC116_g14945 [Phytophthora cactorum]|nr:hypothetical protein PC116_g14965 [Phytophthora cactorum]KAG4236969.1 hypothetical protein PC116_g14945 [Phytophthora cactorum]
MQPFRTLPFDEDGGREVFDGPVKQKQQSNIPLIPPRKIYPVEGHVNNDAKDQNSEKSSTKSVSSHQNAARPGMKISHEHRTLRRWVLLVDGYLGVFVKMLTSLRSSNQSPPAHQLANLTFSEKVGKALQDATDQTTVSRVTSATVQLAFSLTRQDSLARKRIKLLMKFGDLALETLLLYQMLEAAMMFVPHERAPLAETLIDVLFDFLIIVGCPMLVIFYCLSSFTFDRAKFAINLEVFPTGWFEQEASMIADAEQTAVIYESLKSLRILTPLNIFTRIGVNMTLCFRLWQLVDLLRDTKTQNSSVYPKRHRFGAAFLIVFAIMLIVFVEESMRTSSLACQPHPECVVNARRWTIVESGSLTQCPCIMLIDRDIAPKTYAEWENPTNVTDKVAQLASMGDLQTLQLTNRYLGVLPEELRRCKGLRHLSLQYTHTQTFPAWIKEFTKLEYLHVDSKISSPMVVLPDDMFEDMSALTFLHFAAFVPMVKLPSFDGLTNLKSLTLAVFLLLEELPTFDHLHNLERIVLSFLPAIGGLPDFSPIKDLKFFAGLDRGAWCCNGFLGACDLRNDNCGVHPFWGSPAVSCLDPNRSENLATPATLAAVETFKAFTCGPVLQPGTIEMPPTPEKMAPCNGTMYRQCGNTQSMCYNARFMGIACTETLLPVEMRRRQIAQGVGDPCDPDVEAWLGCK